MTTKKLTFAIIGAGYFAKNYIRLFNEIDGLLLKSVANNKRDANKIANDPTIDCLIIASPGSAHFTQSLTGLRAGKHVLVEKPMVMNVREAKLLARAVQVSRRTLLVGHQYLYNDHIRHLKGQLKHEKMGKVYYMHAEHFYLGPLRNDMGVFMDVSPHILAIVDFLFGDVQLKKVFGMKSRFPDSKYDDYVSVSMTFDSGLLLTLSASRFAPCKSRKIYIGAKKGLCLYDEYAPEKLKYILHEYPQRKQFAGHGSIFFTVPSAKITTHTIKTREPLKNQLLHFVDCILRNREPVTGVQHGLRVTKLMQEIYRNIHY